MTVSFSRLDGWHQCKLKHKHKYIDGLEEIENSWSTLGTFVHEVLEKHQRGEINLLEYVEINYPSLVFPKLGRTDLAVKYQLQLMDFFRYISNQDVGEVLGIEENFDIPFGEHNIIGFIDRVSRKNGVSVVDWKISNPFADKDLPKKRRQLYVYAKHIFNKYGEYPKEMFFYFCKDLSFHKEVFSKDLFDETWEWVETTTKEIVEATEYPASPEKFFCSHLCGTRHLCKYGQL